MEEGGPSMPAGSSGRGQILPNPATDSFKDDIQAIGRAVERLRDGFVGADSSSPKPTPTHDSSQSGGFVSSSPTLGSAGGVSVDLRGGRSHAPRITYEIADRSPSPGPGGGEGQRTFSSSPARELSSARGGGSGSLVGGGTTPVESSVLDRMGNSNGRLSLRELRSADEARKFYADERARATVDTAGDHRDAAAVGMALASGEKAPTSIGSSTGSRNSSSKRRGHRQAGNGGRAASSDERRGARAAAAVAGGGRRRHDDTPRGAPEEGQLRLQGDQGSLLTSDGETPAAGSPGRRGGEGWKHEVRDRSQKEACSNGRNGSCGSAAAAREQGSEEEGSAGEAGGVVPAESGSLFELRDALRSREKELLRLERDVSVVASSAGGFNRLAASLGSSNTNNAGTGQRRSFAFDHRGDAEEDGDRSGSRSGAPGASYLFSSGGLGGADGASGSGSGLLLPRHSVESSLAGTSASHLTTASMAPPPATDSPRRIMHPPPPRRRQQPQQQQQLVAAASGGTAPVAVSGSPLVASAHEGLRQMRVMLEQRAVEAERAKDDSKNMTASLNDVSARLRRSERRRAAQATELAEARAAADAAKSELSRALARHRAKEKRAAAEKAAAAQQDKKKESEAAAREAREKKAVSDGFLADPARQRQLFERDAEISRLRDRLEAAAGELSEEQGTTASLRTRLESSEREARRERERAASAEDEAEVAAAAQATRAAEQARKEAAAAAAAAAAELRTAEEEGRRHAREATRARESLRVERGGKARLALELEAAVRERTQAVEKLAAAEAEAGRLHVKLSAASTAAEDIQTAQRERDAAKENLRGAVAELANLTAALVLAREGQEAERGRFDRESKRAAALGEELVASEARRKVQEEEVALVRKQVSRLDAKIEEDMIREKAKSDATAEATAAGAERESDSLRASLRQTEAELLASRSRERHAAGAADASLKRELAAAKDTIERTEEALAATLERARAAEGGAEMAAQASRQDKDTLKRGLVASQTACAELRAERSRLLSELEHAASSAAVAAATAEAEASLGSASSFSSPTDVGRGDGGGRGGRRGRGGDDASTAVARAVETAAAAATLHRTRTDLEGRLALALAEAAEARAETQRLKRQAEVSEREHRTSVVVAGQVSHAARGRAGAGGGGSGGDEERARLQEALRGSCRVMGRVATALSAAADDGTGSPRHGGGGSELDDRRWAAGGEKRWRRTTGSAGAGRNDSLAAGALTSRSSGRRPGSRRRRRAFSVDGHSGAGDGGDGGHRRYVVGSSFGDSSDGGDEGSTGDEARRVVSRSEVREVSERLRFEASRLLGVRADEQRAAEDKKARLRQDLRDSESREAEAAARLEESRELSREQTGFVEGVWKERRRLESELDDRREEVDRLRASEDAARAAAAVLDGKVEDMSAALRQEKARAKREAEAAVAAEARDAVEALRRQLDDLRKEVDRTKSDQLDDGGGGVRGRGSNPDGAASGLPAADGAGQPRGVRRKGESSAAAAVGGVVASPTSPPSLAVLEAEFQRLRAKYEKAKGRIVALEELVAASRRVSAQARREFQGALEALKLSQELLLRIHRQRQGHHHGTDTNNVPATASDPSNTTAAATCTEAQLRQRATATATAAAATAEEEEQRPGVEARASSTDAHVHELAAQASKLRGMSGNVKRLLEIAAGEVQGALEDTRGSLGVAAAAAAAAATAVAGTQTHQESGGPTKEEVDALKQQLRDATAAARALEVDKSRLDGELGTAVGELARVQGLLREKAAEALVLEAQVARLEAEGRETREALSAADDRLAGTEATEAQLSETRACLDAAHSAQAELRGRCAELSLASGAFAAEVAKQKEERSRSQERARLAAEASAAELRERNAELSRASEAATSEAAAERARLEKALQATQAEAREIDSDVAQVLDALAASEKGRRRLEAELDRQVKITGAARVATRAAEGAAAAAHAREGMGRERRELGEKSGRLEGPVQQQEVSRLKESLEREAERRGQLEKECKVLAARATDLEAALISASSEVRKAAKLAAERGARFERDATALSEETARLKAALQEKTAATEAETRSAVEAVRREHREAVAVAVAEAAERARREGTKDEQERTAEAREREKRDCAALRKEMSETTGTLEAETTLRARAAQELSAHRRRVEELEAALEREKATARAASEVARKAASDSPMSQLQAEMRSVISSLEPRVEKSEEEGLEAGTGRTHRRRRQELDQEDSGGMRREGAREGGEEVARNADDRRAAGQEQKDRLSGARRGLAVVRQGDRRDETAHANVVVGDKSGVVGDTPQPACPRRRSNAEVRHNEIHLMGGVTPLAGPSSTSFSGAGPTAAASVAASPNARRGGNEVAVPIGQAAPVTAAPAPAPAPGASAPEQAAAVPALPLIDILPGGSGRVGTVNGNNEEDDDVSLSSVLSGVSSTTRTSGMSSSFTSAALPPQPRRGSVVVRGDWKAGQREAFSELDRKASASASPDDVGVGGGGGGGGAFAVGRP